MDALYLPHQVLGSTVRAVSLPVSADKSPFSALALSERPLSPAQGAQEPSLLPTLPADLPSAVKEVFSDWGWIEESRRREGEKGGAHTGPTEDLVKVHSMCV